VSFRGAANGPARSGLPEVAGDDRLRGEPGIQTLRDLGHGTTDREPPVPWLLIPGARPPAASRN